MKSRHVVAALGLALVLAEPALAQAPAAPVPTSQADVADASLSPECRVPGSKLYTIASLCRVKRALREHRVIKVLAVGASATVGDASSPAASYPARLEDQLEKLFPGVDIDVVNRGISGEIAGGAVDRLKNIVAEVQPDLLVWQVGTNDALARVDPETFAESMNETINWLRGHKIDVVLVDPQYAASLAKDDYYGRIVQIVEDVARRERVPLVHRFAAMRYLADRKQGPYLTSDQFQLSDLSYRCMAEHVAHAVTVGLLQAEVQPSPEADAAPAK